MSGYRKLLGSTLGSEGDGTKRYDKKEPSLCSSNKGCIETAGALSTKSLATLNKRHGLMRGFRVKAFMPDQYLRKTSPSPTTAATENL